MSVDKENMAGIRRWSEVKMGRIFGADEREFIEAMADAVSTGSEGVFLWTKFALDEVIDGRTKGFDTNEILDNLRQLPRDMVKLYERIIDRKTSEERKETGLLMAPFLGAHNQNDLALSQLLEAMVLAQPLDTHDLTKMKPLVIDEKMLVNFRLRISHISGGMIETVQKRLESNRQREAYELKDVRFKPRMQVGMRVMHRTVETYMDSPEASNQLYGGLSVREVMYGSWLKVCARHLQGSWVRWSDLDDSWFFVKIPYRLVRPSDRQDSTSLLHEWELVTIPEDTELQSQPFPFSHRMWKYLLLKGPRWSKPPRAFWHPVHSVLVKPSSRLWLVSGKGSPIAQVSLQSHVFRSVTVYASLCEIYTDKSCWALTKDLFTIELFHAHYSWVDDWPASYGCLDCLAARRIRYEHLGIMTNDMNGASLAVWHNLAGFLHELFERGHGSNLDMQALFQYAAARAGVTYNPHDVSRHTLHTIEHWSRIKNQPLTPIPSELVVRALQFSACEDIEIILSLHGSGSVLLTGVQVCQFFVVLPGRPPCRCIRSKSREPCPTVECRPLFALCFGPGSYGRDASSAELDVSPWLIPRLKLLTSRGEDINGICGPHDATVLQTAVSLLLFDNFDLNRYIWNGTIFFDTFVSFGANPALEGPYGNILEQFWMQIHESKVLKNAMESEKSKSYLGLLEECQRFLHRLVDEFRLENCRTDPSSKIPTVEAMRSFGCNYHESDGHSDGPDSTCKPTQMRAVSWFSYEQERQYYLDYNAETKGTRIFLLDQTL
ncbi:hypothetical protein V8F06_005022 [Rhypophila decipiens]